MIVIKRNGRATVITGWRAWLLGAAVLIVAWVLLAMVIFVLLGVAITVGAALLILLPTAALVALLAALFRPR
jgi:hypothetical protein